MEIHTKENRDSSCKLLAVHVEIVHDAVNLGSSQSRSVDVVENVQDAHDRPGRLVSTQKLALEYLCPAPSYMITISILRTIFF